MQKGRTGDFSLTIRRCIRGTESSFSEEPSNKNRQQSKGKKVKDTIHTTGLQVKASRPKKALLGRAACVFAVALVATCASADELWIGAATTSITPERPIALAGQMGLRVAKTVESPCMATAVVLETRREGKTVDQAIMVSCDLAAIRGDVEGSSTSLGQFVECKVLEQFRRRVKPRLVGFDVGKLFLNATHTHTSAVTYEGFHDIPKDVMQPKEYLEFFMDRLGEMVVKAWEGRRPGGVSWGLGHAVVAQNRRAVYANGTAKMYGNTDVPELRGLEGYEDHAVEVLFFWDQQKKLIATAVNLACTAQEVENGKAVNADFWHEVREDLRSRYGEKLCVLGWIGAAGDQSPHLMYRKAAEERMRKLRGLTRLQEISRRIVKAVDEVYAVVKDDIHTDVPMVHKVKTIPLPIRMVTEEELAEAKKQAAALLEQEKRGANIHGWRMWHERLIDRYEWQKSNPTYPMEAHVIRLGDVAICTNPFELFTDYGVRIKARSQALQTFVIQLAGPGTYLPTERAVRGGHYSAIVQSNFVGPEAGQVLVDRTVEILDDLWKKPGK